MIQFVVCKLRSLLHHRNQAELDDHARGKERNRRALLTGSVAMIARVVQVSTSLITVPLTLKYLGNERFGLWMTISSVLAMAAFADFGVGNGVLNAVAKAFGQDDVDGIRGAVSSGFAVLSSIAIFLLIAFFSVFHFIDWANFFRVVSPVARSEAGPALAIFATCFALNISMDVVQRVQLGLQQGYRYSLWQLCGSLFGFTGVLCGIWLRVKLPVLILAIAGGPVLATAINIIHFFNYVRPDLRPSKRYISSSTILHIIRLGGLFFVLQVVCAISFSADNFIIARTVGAIYVPEYSIPQRMFSLISMMSAMLVAPLWPAYRESISRGHIAWARHTLRKSLILVFGGTLVCSSLLLAFSHTLIHWWVGSRIHPTFVLLIGLAVWTVFTSCGDALAMFMNGGGVITFQLVTASAFGLACLALKVFLVRFYGVSAIPYATIITYTLFSIIPCSIYIPIYIGKLTEYGSDAGPGEQRATVLIE